MSDYNITIVRGRTYTWAGQVTVFGSGEDLTGQHMLFIAKYDLRDPDSAAVFSLTDGAGITYTSPVGGEFTVTIGASDTSGLSDQDEAIELEYELIYQKSVGLKYSIMSGQLIVLPRAAVA